ncbi:monofunctional biosynthetic peptidoglycan transglycosylase [uncultured Litoreibacter sp.]|uniref:monofunctional biosynthetic peptidoglycan transglycosylase n=1 Tax=uncultured Litoreibacter sp. TaxID=1392394 RepID=UPI002602A858|nr:monofunctional biosynthetic peptidoglycan transglycosylase [uncultured Litoreibacter sp.]
MAKAAKKKKPNRSIFWWIGVVPHLIFKWGGRALLGVIAAVFLLIGLYAFVNPPTTIYILQESARLDGIRREWRDFEDISPHMPRAIVAAEDANFCKHWGFDMQAIRDALEDGGGRGASTVSQQTVKNTFLWHGRNYVRKAMEAALTPVVEAIWTKRRILEVYMNIAEFDEGVFGVAAAAPWYFGVDAKDLSARQAAALAAVLPNPKGRSAKRPTAFLKKRARQINSGAETIRLDGRSACFEG